MDLIEASELSLAARLWQETRFDIFRDVLVDAGVLARPTHVLDVGSGDAWFARQLVDREPSIVDVTCWDVGYDDPGVVARVDASSPKLRLRAERPTERFDLVLALDVLEHVDDDVGFFSRIVAENLAGGGHAFVSVPAWQSLFGEHDRRLKHFRRYDAVRARRAVEASGLEVVRSGGAFYAPLAVRAAQVAAERVLGLKPKTADSGSGRPPPSAVAALARAGFRGERVLASWMSARSIEVPGLSWWALCRKRS